MSIESRSRRFTSFAAVVCVGIVGLAWAGPEHKDGPPPGPGEREAEHSERMLEMLDDRLELTAEQRSKVKAITEEGKPQREALRKEMEALHEKMKKLMFAQTEKIRDVLKDEQKMKFDEMKMMMVMMHQAQGGPGRMGRMKGHRRGPGKRFGPGEDDERGHGEHGPGGHGPHDGPPPPDDD